MGNFFFLETVGSFFCDKHCGEFSLIGFLLFLFLIFVTVLTSFFICFKNNDKLIKLRVFLTIQNAIANFLNIYKYT